MSERMLNDDITRQLTEVLANLQHPVEIVFFGSETENCEYCRETRQLLEEVTSISDRLSLQVHLLEESSELAAQFKVDAVPTFVITGLVDGERTDYGIRYKGIPAGHEFTSLVNDLLMVSRADSGLSDETKEFLSGLKQPIHLEVFVTPTWPYCPRAVVLAHQFALESPFVEAEMVEAMEFPDLADLYSVSGVPHTAINRGAGHVVGSVPEGVLLDEIRRVVEASK